MNLKISDGQSIDRQAKKRDERIAELAKFGVVAVAQDLNGARIGAREMDLFLRLLNRFYSKPQP